MRKCYFLPLWYKIANDIADNNGSANGSAVFKSGQCSITDIVNFVLQEKVAKDKARINSHSQEVHPEQVQPSVTSQQATNPDHKNTSHKCKS